MNTRDNCYRTSDLCERVLAVFSDETFNQCRFADLIQLEKILCLWIFTPGGPTTATTTGGASSGVRSTIGTCSLFSAI